MLKFFKKQKKSAKIVNIPLEHIKGVRFIDGLYPKFIIKDEFRYLYFYENGEYK